MDLWVVGRVWGNEWEFQGVFDSEEKAKGACREDKNWSYFVAPAILNENLSYESEEWPGAYYPLLAEEGHV